MKRSIALASSSRQCSKSIFLEPVERRVLYSTTVLNPDGSVMGRLDDHVPTQFQYAAPAAKRGSANGDGAAGFQITLHFGSGLTGSQQAAFQAAAARWQRVLTADVPDAVVGTTTVDDLLINASGRDIDGAGNVLGRAGPTALRGDSGLPCVGEMEFDTADLANMESNGTLLDVITHEMGHVLGIGSLWPNYGLLAGPDNNRIFTGPNALNEYIAYRGPGSWNSAGVPVETDGGAGTADSHWDDGTFWNELMTGYITAAGNPLSRMTAASLIDLGYPGVNVDAAESYSHADWNRAPYIYDFNSNQLTAQPNGNLTMSVANATDADGSPLITKFYRESNGVPGLQSTGAVAGSVRGSAITPDTLVATMPFGVLGTTFNIGNLGVGAYTFYGQCYDIYNEPSGVVSRLINVIPPPPAAPTTPDLLTQLDLGDSGTDNITASQNTVFTGYAEPNSTVTILMNGIGITQRQADGAGYYNVPLFFPVDGTYSIAARATNSTGTGPASAPISLTIDTVAPTISYGYYDGEVTQNVSVLVSDGRASQLNWWYVNVKNTANNTPGPTVKGLTASSDGGFADLDLGTPLPDGRYRINFPLGAVTDVAGNISPEYNYYFSQLNGDANNDGAVNFEDLVVLAQNYNTAGNTFSRGNFDYSSDGKVNFSDLVILAQHYNAALPPAGLSASGLDAQTSRVAASLFSEGTIEDGPQKRSRTVIKL